MKFLVITISLITSGFAFALSETQQEALAYAKSFHKEVMKQKSITVSLNSRNASYGNISRNSKDMPEIIAPIEKEWRGHTKALKVWMKSGKKRGAAEPRPPEVVSRVLNADCSKALSNLANNFNRVVEVFVMDKLGANVCTNTLTGDYDQGDESKWVRVFKEGQAEFVDKPELDKSSRKLLTQVNLPIKDESGNTVGVITIGVQK